MEVLSIRVKQSIDSMSAIITTAVSATHPLYEEISDMYANNEKALRAWVKSNLSELVPFGYGYIDGDIECCDTGSMITLVTCWKPAVK